MKNLARPHAMSDPISQVFRPAHFFSTVLRQACVKELFYSLIFLGNYASNQDYIQNISSGSCERRLFI